MELHIGDWVRFQRGGQLVIGEVAYVKDRDVLGYRQAITDIGAVREDAILERRASLKETSAR